MNVMQGYGEATSQLDALHLASWQHSRKQILYRNCVVGFCVVVSSLFWHREKVPCSPFAVHICCLQAQAFQPYHLCRQLRERSASCLHNVRTGACPRTLSQDWPRVLETGDLIPGSLESTWTKDLLLSCPSARPEGSSCAACTCTWSGGWSCCAQGSTECS